MNLEEYEDIFAQEAEVMSYAKYTLLRNEELDDFFIDGIYVSVYENSDGYELYFNGHVLNIEIFDKQIVDFDLSNG